MTPSSTPPKNPTYTAQLTWTGNTGVGTKNYTAYLRTWEIRTPGKPVIQCSNDPLLGGDPALPNPEDLLLSSVSACHMLWYLHLASSARIVVSAYEDTPLGIGEISNNGAGRFTGVTLRPTITLANATDESAADAIHGQIHQYCFIARSLNFAVKIDANYQHV